MSNEALKFAYDIVCLHEGLQEAEIVNEIERRIERGAWLDVDKPVPVHAEQVPKIFHYFPFSLLWSQRPSRQSTFVLSHLAGD
jgi:hypothetical protein